MGRRRKNYWVQKLDIKKGGLRQQLGVPKGRKIPPGLLKRIAEGNIGTHFQYGGRTHTITPLLKRRAVLARTFSRMKR